MTTSISDLSQHDFQQTTVSSSSKSSPRLVRFFLRAVLAAVIILLLPFLTASCIPILKPVALSVLQRLWNVLRFLVITTIILFSILNAQRKTHEKAGEHRHSRTSALGHMDTIFDDNGQEKTVDQKDGTDLDVAEEMPRRTNSVRLRKGNECNVDQPRENCGTLRKTSAKRAAEGPAQVEYQAKKHMICDRAGDQALVSTFRSHEQKIRDNCAEQVEKSGSRETKDAATFNRFALSSRNSRSALDLYQFDNTGEMSNRNSGRNTSLSCDFGDDYSPEWLYAYPLPPPPTPPDADSSSDSEPEKSSPTPKTPTQTESASQAVAVWRSSPVDIAQNSNPSILQAPPSPIDEGMRSISPSPGEVNRKADAFISKFHEQMRMQLLESYERRWRL